MSDLSRVLPSADPCRALSSGLLKRLSQADSVSVWTVHTMLCPVVHPSAPHSLIQNAAGHSLIFDQQAAARKQDAYIASGVILLSSCLCSWCTGHGAVEGAGAG